MFKSITLEMSLKPFKSTDEKYMRSVIEKLFEQWSILVSHADEISVMLWTADGSEILDWHGDFDEEFEWCSYVGGANNLELTEESKKHDPEGTGLHSRSYPYMDNPPVFTYKTLKKIVSLIKQIGHEVFPDKKIRVGETFDPGPEFARSSFKYERHNEICRGASMGAKSMVCCYATLHADNVKYAGFPDGIPEGLEFGTFFGRQSQLFLDAMGFDYLWLSNGFGFGMETWSTTGAVFDGKDFDVSRFDEIKEKIIGFWKLFRKECPNYRIETRGTNLSVGIDLATDGVPLKDIYEGGFNLLPPPNSPWAALDANFGLEISGYLSRICNLPGDEYLFRYYVHDPWWSNTPWTDRYDSLPHDIYLPMMVCRLDENGETKLPTHLNILSVDNSFGEMPGFCAHEPSVYINKALRYAPDEPSPVVWVYPFEEYHSMRDKKSIKEMFFGDWFICGAMNHSLPIGSVVSTNNFVKAMKGKKDAYKASVLISIVPVAGSEYEREILDFVKRGGKVIFYGSVDRASKEFLAMAGIKVCHDEAYGEMEIEVCSQIDRLKSGKYSDIINHRSVSCGGGVDTELDGNRAKVLYMIGGRVGGVYTDNMVWLKGTCSAEYISGHLITPDDENKYYSGDSIMRLALDKLGIQIRLEKENAASYEPVIIISRHDNAYMFSACAKDTTVKERIKMKIGAPVMIGGETRIDEEGFAQYHFSKAELGECRVFVKQQETGVISCHYMTGTSFFNKNSIIVEGLKDATVRFFAPKHCMKNVPAVVNCQARDFKAVGDDFESEYITDENGTYLEARHITGDIIFSIPFEKLHATKF